MWFDLHVLSEIFRILRRMRCDVITNVRSSSCKVASVLFRFQLHFKFSGQSFEKYSNIKFYKNPFTESRVIPCGQTDSVAGHL